MKQKLILLLCTLLSTLGAWAIDVKIASTGSGLPSSAGFGSFSGQVFTTATGSGLAGVTVTAEPGSEATLTARLRQRASIRLRGPRTPASMV